ncbi:MAG: sensor histidine kinase [Vicinamibacteraceae bacterium]
MDWPVSSLLRVGLIHVGNDGEVDYASPEACTSLGCRDVDDLRARWKPIAAKLEPALRSTGEEPAEVQVTLEVDGVARELRCQLHAIDDEECIGHLVIVEPMARARSLESTLRLASRYKTLVPLYVATAHDFKGSLNALRLNVEVVRHALTTSTQATPAAASQSLRVIDEEVTRLQRSVGAILEEWRMERPDAESLDLRRTVHAIAGLYERTATRQGVAILLNLPDAPVDVRGRADWIQQALFNLVTNALEAMPGGGTLSIHVAATNGTVSVRVCDTGSGISENVLPHIWEPYFTTKPNGHGLGLHVVRRVARAHGGEVRVSATAPGTCFSLTLPCETSG